MGVKPILVLMVLVGVVLTACQPPEAAIASGEFDCNHLLVPRQMLYEDPEGVNQLLERCGIEGVRIIENGANRTL